MKIKITEQQFYHLINEGSGVNKDILAIAECIIDSIMENHLYDLQEEFDNSGYDDFYDFASDFFEEIGTDSVWYETTNYHGEQYYSFYYENSNSKGRYNYDYSEVEINYNGIERILDKADKLFSQVDNGNKGEWIKLSLQEYLLPILTHELTHSLDSSESEAQGKWLGSHYHFNDEDLRDILYIFSKNEMNARIGSVSGIVKSNIHSLYMDKKPDREEYGEFIQDILDDNDLSVNYMSLLLDVLYREMELLKTCNTSKERFEHKKSSLLYDLFKNDTRLQNNRTLKQMFKSNSLSAFDYVYRFYIKLFDNYKKKLMRAIYYMLENND